MKKFRIASLILFSMFTNCSSDFTSQHTDCLDKAAYKISSVNIQSNDSDLLFLKNILEDDSVKIVLLGDYGNIDTVSFSGKTKLVKFLHEKCGFDVIAFENSFYDCAKGWELTKQNNDYNSSISLALGSLPAFKSGNCAYEAFIKYLQNTLNSKNPLIFAGIGNGLSSFKHEDFIADVNRLNLLKTNDENERLIKIIRSLDPNPFAPSYPDSGIIKYNVNFLDTLLERVNKQDYPEFSDLDREFWLHVIRGLIQSNLYYNELKLNYIDALNKLNTGKTDNLIWLVEKKYPGKKIIIWADNFSACRGFKHIEFSKQRGDFLKNVYSLDDALYDTYRNKVYSIILTSYQSELGVEPEFTLEYSVEHSGFKYAFLNLRDKTGLDCIGNYFYTGALLREEKAEWNKVLDGFFVYSK